MKDNLKLKVGDRKILNKKTFLYQGIFVIQGSSVEIVELGEEITVLWNDKEGNPHNITGIKAEELL